MLRFWLSGMNVPPPLYCDNMTLGDTSTRTDSGSRVDASGLAGLGEIESPEVVDALEALLAGVDALAALDMSLLSDVEANAFVASVEFLGRRVDAARVDVTRAASVNNWYMRDGHRTAKVMVRHLGQLSAAEGAQRAKLATMFERLQLVAAAYRAGRIGTGQARLFAKVYSNPRVRQFFAVSEQVLLDAAVEMSYPDFAGVLLSWERLVDDSGAFRDSEVEHQKRFARLSQNDNGSWDLTARSPDLAGAQMDEILDHYASIERLADYEKAKAKYGDNWEEHLDRTPEQQVHDALLNIFADAASSQPGSRQAGFVTNIVIDQETFERQLARMAGAQVQPDDPHRASYRCHTSNGVPLHPYTVVAEALIGHVRRVVINSANTVIDQGRLSRLFTGSARLATMLQSDRCTWPGCWIRSDHCQADHLKPHGHGGRTCPGNGAPLCGKHNRIKNHGYETWRDDTGQWHVTRPDGTEIPDYRRP